VLRAVRDEARVGREKKDEKFEEMKITLTTNQEKMKARINAIRSEFELTIKHRVENVLSSLDQRKQDLRKELDARIEAMQRGIEKSLDTPTRNLYE
jgi:DNA anti-recombination protein RmuC